MSGLNPVGFLMRRMGTILNVAGQSTRYLGKFELLLDSTNSSADCQYPETLSVSSSQGAVLPK